MTELFEKSIATLELPRVLELLADCAVTAEGRERCLALRPLTDGEDVERALAETTAAADLLARRGGPPFGGIKPVGASLQRADRGGSLNTRELLDIAAVLRCARRAGEYGETEEKTAVAHLFRSLTPNRFLEEQITGSILSEDEIADSASTQLASIRRHIRATEAKVRDMLQKLISSNQSKYLQESIITIRSDRYVVPVKAEHKNAIPGLVHDVSSSGSTFFIEPMGVVKANNDLRELQGQEKKEIERILAELSVKCAEFKEDIQENYTLLVLLDCIFARGSLSLRLDCSRPELTEGALQLFGARHPLLDPKKAVRNDLELGGRFDTLVITGPNTGGKTVTLKTLGLLTLMAQCGLHIPAREGSRVRVFRKVLADIGDEQSIAQSLSTFSSHMTNLVGILAEVDEDSLVLLDELGAGTDPVEGAALAEAILTSARALGAKVAATTHYAELKVYAMTTPGVENACCEFQVETLAPTYRLVMGVPGKSNAFAISRRLGLPEYIIEKAARRLDSENVRFEDVLTQLEQRRQELEGERESLRRLRLEAEESARAAGELRRKLEAEREKAAEKARAEAHALLREAREATDLVFSELKDMRRKQMQEEDWNTVNQRRVEVRRLLNQAEEELDAAAPVEEEAAPVSTRPAREGDTVELLSMGVRGTVLSVGKEGALQIRAGVLTVTARQEEVRVAEGAQPPGKGGRQAVQTAHRPLNLQPAATELDLRGMESLEAVAVLEQFLDGALMAKLETVRVIHGKGTGAVRRAVREHLKKSRYVKSFRPGRYGEGEDGVTVAELK